MKKILYQVFLLTGLLWATTGLQAQVPVAYYPFSGNAKDASAFANHATVNGALLTQDRFGWSNSAMAFDGTQSYVRAANAAQLNSPVATVAFWINVNELPASGEVFLISLGGWQERFKISLPDHGKVIFTTNYAGGISDMDAGTGNELQPGVWTHVVCVHDGTKDKIYINGAKVAEKDVVGDLNPTTHPLGIGYSPLDNDYFFNGALDEVILLDVALSDFQIAAAYAIQNTPPTVASGKVASYSFDGNAGDGSSFVNHANMVDGKITTDRFGYGNSALLCNGTSTEVTAPNGAQLNSPYTTVSFWVKPNSLPVSGQVYLLSFGDWSQRWKISLPDHGKPVWTTNYTAGISDMDSGGGNELQPGVWTHVVMVHDGAKDFIYMDGAMVAEKDVVGELNNASAPLAFGYSPGNGLWFDGVLDEVEIYNYALSATEIGDLYTAQSTFPGVPSPLVAGYSLNGNGLDESQFGNTAQLDDAAVAVANRHGWGGNALFGSATADNSIALQTPYTTISFWVKPNSLPPSGEVFLLSNGGWQERWKISLPDHGKPVFTTNYSGGISDMDSGGGNELQVDVWTHVVMVHDGLKDLIYMNGVQVAEKDVVGDLNTTNHPLGIGYDPIGGGLFFDGTIDDVAIFNIALSAPQIAALYGLQNPEPVVAGDMVAYYPFSGNGWDVTDYHNHSSGVAFAPDQFNRVNNAAAFNGTSTEVTAANSPQLNTPKTTISFWVNPNSLPASGQVYLLSHGDWSERWKISLPDHGKPVFTTNYIGGISDMDSGGGNELQVGVWTHVVMVHDGLKDIIYMDGAMVAEKDVVGDLNNTTMPLGIGYSPGNGLWFDGMIDEVQIYKVALSASEIADLYAAQSTPPVVTDTEAPDAPLNLTAEVGFNHVTLSWYPAIDNVGVVAYNVYIDGALAATTANLTAYFPGLTPLTEFLFGVTAIDAEGNESVMTTRNVTTGLDEEPDITPPTPPGNLQGNAASNSIIFTWDASIDDTQVAGYVTFVDGVYADSISASSLSYYVGGLEPLTLYTFEVYAFDLSGNNSTNSELTISTTEPIVTSEPGLVAHYPFDGDAKDATPYHNDGVIGGDPVFEAATNGFGGQNIKFDGMQDSVLVPNAPQLISDYATVSFWIRVDAVTTDPECYVIDFGHWDERWKISIPQHLKIVWTTNYNNAQFPELIHNMDSGDGNEMVVGFWWYVTMVHDGTNDIIYVNGAEANSNPVDGELNTTGRPLNFGSDPVGGKLYFTGALDNVKIYNKALTAQEILNLFETGVSGTDEPTNLLQAYIQDVFPNPVSDVLTVKHQLPSNQQLLLRVFDMQGRQIDQLRLSEGEVSTGQFSLNASSYPQGMYTLNFVLGGKNLGSLMFNKH
ncbi:MAG: T9SS type A sorting domain-containing protein [Saprospirales bacterium]|nr:T9SS type A sorting domain-containing protein [Saprospirales bacterium]